VIEILIKIELPGYIKAENFFTFWVRKDFFKRIPPLNELLT